VSVLRRVFLDLKAETPTWLLSRELWAASADPTDWWRKVQTYSRSLAVMSIVGYIIGRRACACVCACAGWLVGWLVGW